MKMKNYILIVMFAFLSLIASVALAKSDHLIGAGVAFLCFLTLMACLAPDTTQSKSKTKSGLEYEHWCAKKMIESGKYRQVTVTPPTGDFGADIVAVDRAKRKWVFQCKYYKSKLGNAPIQEVVGAKSHYHADCAAVVTNSTFTPKAKQLARENKVKLYEEVDKTGSPKKTKKQWKNYSVEEMIFYDDIFD